MPNAYKYDDMAYRWKFGWNWKSKIYKLSSEVCFHITISHIKISFPFPRFHKYEHKYMMVAVMSVIFKWTFQYQAAYCAGKNTREQKGRQLPFLCLFSFFGIFLFDNKEHFSPAIFVFLLQGQIEYLFCICFRYTWKSACGLLGGSE